MTAARHATTALPQAIVSPARTADWGDRALARTWRTFGMLCFGIGVVNAFIPLMPTTVFLLIGLWAYGKGDPAMRERLLNHPRYGASLRLWVEHRQISRKGKVAACLGIAASAGFTAWAIGAKPVMWMVLAGLAALVSFIATREEPQA
jgi:uncharacterized membrane protein YbaN (DUF454 family)